MMDPSKKIGNSSYSAAVRCVRDVKDNEMN